MRFFALCACFVVQRVNIRDKIKYLFLFYRGQIRKIKLNAPKAIGRVRKLKRIIKQCALITCKLCWQYDTGPLK